MPTPVWCRERAAVIGPATALFIDTLLGDRPLDRLCSAQGVLRLAERYGTARLEAACARAHAASEYRYHTVKTILAHALDAQPMPFALAPMPKAALVPARHARPWTTFFPDPAAEEERSRWN
jgi:hypothetical protein